MFVLWTSKETLAADSPPSSSPSRPPSRDEAEYVQALEELFIVLRQQGLMLSPKDKSCVLRWHKKGIPLHIAARSIVDGIEKFREEKGDDTPLPSSISYFSAAVVRAGKTIQRVVIHNSASSEPTPQENPEDPILKILAAVVSRGQEESQPSIKLAYRKLYKRLRNWEASRQNQNASTSWDRELQQFESALIEDVKEGLSEPEKATLEARVEKRFNREKRTLGTQAKKERFQAIWKAEIRAHFNLLVLETKR